MDKIYIDRIHINCIIGTNDDERERKQEIIISVCLYTDTVKAAETDDLSFAIDYYSVKRKIMKAAAESRYFLLETMAQKIADICLAFDGVKKVDVTVEKPQALLLTDNVRVCISREQLKS